MYIFVEEEIPCIQDEDFLSLSLYCLYRRCSSGETTRLGCSSPSGIDLAVDIVAVKDVDLSDFTPREGSYSCNEENERDNDSHQSLTHRYPSQ
jgi:hypothetical protein